MCEGLVAVTQNKPGKCWQPLPELAGAFGGSAGQGPWVPGGHGGSPGLRRAPAASEMGFSCWSLYGRASGAGKGSEGWRLTYSSKGKP